MTVCCPGWIGTRTTECHLKRRISTNCCIHMVYFLMMGLDTSETCTGWWNILSYKLCIKLVFLYTRNKSFRDIRTKTREKNNIYSNSVTHWTDIKKQNWMLINTKVMAVKNKTKLTKVNLQSAFIYNNSLSYNFSAPDLYILFARANWHSSAILTGFSVLFPQL